MNVTQRGNWRVESSPKKFLIHFFPFSFFLFYLYFFFVTFSFFYLASSFLLFTNAIVFNFGMRRYSISLLFVLKSVKKGGQLRTRKTNTRNENADLHELVRRRFFRLPRLCHILLVFYRRKIVRLFFHFFASLFLLLSVLRNTVYHEFT